ncbi:MAG TPA: YidC/Oxa1 family membrane protein insertase [Candidatus Elarobacter sp.]|nr:YidC/Oxa1 family membrane protein insertase [Candidatus Elarobacter sp.]
MLLTNFFSPLFDPLVRGMGDVLTAVHHVVPSYGWSLVIVALIVRVAIWPLSNMQFRSMAEMQKVQPLVKKLQAQYKNDPQALNAATMALYKEHNVNPLAGCLPMLIPLPILFALYYAIQSRLEQFHEPFLWIGSPMFYGIYHWHPPLAIPSLASMDYIMLLLYVASMYFTVRYGSPPSQDPQQAQTQKIMAFMSPAIIAYMGFKYQWASAFYVYWFALNVFTVGQQAIMLRRYGMVGRAGAAPAGAGSATTISPSKVAAEERRLLEDSAAKTDGKAAANGKRTYRPKKRARR